MHFIGNRAIVLGDGSKKLQLVYGPGYSVLSAFLPIVVLTVAFGLAELQWKSARSHWIGLIITGICSGLSVVGMHYVGNLGISNYKLQYRPGTFTASFIIAISDCLTVMLLFYTWREKWISHFYKRLICSSVLAAGISAMHFTAASNCVYYFQHYSDSNAVLSRNIQVIIAGVFCGAAGLAMLGLIIWSRYRDRVSKKGAKKIMLNCVMFHPDDRRFLVTTEGMLPAREITDKYNHRTFNEEFDTAHEVFHWMFRVTRNWTAVSSLILQMKSHLNARRSPDDQVSRPGSSASSARYDATTYTNYSVIFRERFCVAAQQLANSMNLSVDRIGVLFENIIETGTVRSQEPTLRGGLQSMTRRNDMEMAVTEDVYGTGQLLFLTRRLNDDEPDRLLNAGYKYAGMEEVGHIIANTMQIPHATFENHMFNIRRYTNTLTNVHKPGVWLSCFAVVPKIHNAEFDVVVKRTNQDQLPDVQILDREPVQWQEEFFARLHGMKFEDIAVKVFAACDEYSPNTASERSLSTVLRDAMRILREQIPHEWLDKSIFHGRQLKANYSRTDANKSPPTTIYSFVACTELNATLGESTGVIAIPSSFFRARHRCYPGSPNHEVLAGDIHREFAPLLAKKLRRNNAGADGFLTPIDRETREHVRRIIQENGLSQSRRSSTLQAIGEDHAGCSSDEYELTDRVGQLRESEETIREPSPTPPRDHIDTLGGIMVNSQCVVKSDSQSDLSMDVRKKKLGHSTAVTTESDTVPTFVEDLLKFVQKIQKSKQQFGGVVV